MQLIKKCFTSTRSTENLLSCEHITEILSSKYEYTGISSIRIVLAEGKTEAVILTLWNVYKMLIAIKVPLALGLDYENNSKNGFLFLKVEC